MAEDKRVHIHAFVLNPEANGGESLMLTTEYFWNGDLVTDDDGIYTNQSLTLQSYCNCATIKLYGATITPNVLRELANELEDAEKKARKTAKDTDRIEEMGGFGSRDWRRGGKLVEPE